MTKPHANHFAALDQTKYEWAFSKLETDTIQVICHDGQNPDGWYSDKWLDSASELHEALGRILGRRRAELRQGLEVIVPEGMTHTPMVDPQGQPLLRTVVDFRRGVDGVVRTINLNHSLPNAVVGQQLTFDHPTLTRCLTGTITKLSHVVFLDGAPLTYIDVELL